MCLKPSRLNPRSDLRSCSTCRRTTRAPNDRSGRPWFRARHRDSGMFSTMATGRQSWSLASPTRDFRASGCTFGGVDDGEASGPAISWRR